MPFIECGTCNSVVHVSPINEQQFHDRFVDGEEPFLCLDCSRKYVDFRKWCKTTKGFDWVETNANLYGYAMEFADEYEAWCKENNQKPIWNE